MDSKGSDSISARSPPGAAQEESMKKNFTIHRGNGSMWVGLVIAVGIWFLLTAGQHGSILSGLLGIGS